MLRWKLKSSHSLCFPLTFGKKRMSASTTESQSCRSATRLSVQIIVVSMWQQITARSGRREFLATVSCMAEPLSLATTPVLLLHYFEVEISVVGDPVTLASQLQTSLTISSRLGSNIKSCIESAYFNLFLTGADSSLNNFSLTLLSTIFSIPAVAISTGQ